MAERRQGVGGLQSPQPTPSEVSFLSNEGSGRPGRPHWGVRFLFCTRNLTCWGRPRGGCRVGLFSETRERKEKRDQEVGVEGRDQGGRAVETRPRALRQAGRVWWGRRAGGHTCRRAMTRSQVTEG
jgi:hypothetical protein